MDLQDPTMIGVFFIWKNLEPKKKLMPEKEKLKVGKAGK